MERLREQLYGVLEAVHPQTVRQVFYQMVFRGHIDKREQEYKNSVGRVLVQMRKQLILPYDWIADNTRWMRKPRTWRSAPEAVQHLV
jgi:hypothetical protein